MRGVLAGSLGLTLSLIVSTVRAEDYAWRPAAAPPRTAEVGTQPGPVVTLGRPQPLAAPSDQQMEVTPAALGQLTPVSYGSDASSPTYRVARSQSPELSGPTLQPPPGLSPAPPASTSELYNCGVVTRQAGGFWDGGKNFFSGIPGIGGLLEDGAGRAPFQSDHAFDGFISPVTNPFYFEDPRSLTEVRPLFLYQATPIRNSIFHGGDIEFAGMQARLALTDRLSVVMSKLGAIWIEPHNATPDFQTHA